LLPYKCILLVSKGVLPSNNALQRTMPNQNNLWFGICIKLLVTSAYLNFITSKLLADLWHWEFITGFLWSTAALSDSPIIGKAIFLLKMKPNMLLI